MLLTLNACLEESFVLWKCMKRSELGYAAGVILRHTT